ncbi:DsrE family protein [Brevibacillus ruminantium]|uniref:DsrE family protein n=1 Tax=Brevibacillus ruminantium TaxID=2950604 RepID=A0ABY4WDB8_9BACL|nr:DsrE family protein [Brevibacillus ruminantium]USG64899.1 DsrE family protein [Brevibacillus ruminantium]
MQNKVILLASDQFGKGEPALGEAVMETFLVHIKQAAQKPVAIFCMNRGVFTLTEQSLSYLHLKELEEQGVPVYGCKTCVEHYGVADKLMAGQIAGMNHFVELAGKHEVFTIS